MSFLFFSVSQSLIYPFMMTLPVIANTHSCLFMFFFVFLQRSQSSRIVRFHFTSNDGNKSLNYAWIWDWHFWIQFLLWLLLCGCNINWQLIIFKRNLFIIQWILVWEFWRYIFLALLGTPIFSEMCHFLAEIWQTFFNQKRQ